MSSKYQHKEIPYDLKKTWYAGLPINRKIKYSSGANLLAHWRLDDNVLWETEGTEQARDSSANGRHGSYYGTSVEHAGFNVSFGDGLHHISQPPTDSFGTRSVGIPKIYVKGGTLSDLGMSTDTNSSWTISFWIHTNSNLWNQASGQTVIFSTNRPGENSPFMVYLVTSLGGTNIYVRYEDAAGNVGQNFSADIPGMDPGAFTQGPSGDPGKWFHIAVTKTGTSTSDVYDKISYYVNGVLHDTDTTNRNYIDLEPTDTWSILSYSNTSGTYIDHESTKLNSSGRLADLALWNIALPASEIKALAWPGQGDPYQGPYQITRDWSKPRSKATPTARADAYREGQSMHNMNHLLGSFIPKVKSAAPAKMFVGGKDISEGPFDDRRSPMGHTLKKTSATAELNFNKMWSDNKNSFQRKISDGSRIILQDSNGRFLTLCFINVDVRFTRNVQAAADNYDGTADDPVPGNDTDNATGTPASSEIYPYCIDLVKSFNSDSPNSQEEYVNNCYTLPGSILVHPDVSADDQQGTIYDRIPDYNPSIDRLVPINVKQTAEAIAKNFAFCVNYYTRNYGDNDYGADGHGNPVLIAAFRPSHIYVPDSAVHSRTICPPDTVILQQVTSSLGSLGPNNAHTGGVSMYFQGGGSDANPWGTYLIPQVDDKALTNNSQDKVSVARQTPEWILPWPEGYKEPNTIFTAPGGDVGNTRILYYDPIAWMLNPTENIDPFQTTTPTIPYDHKGHLLEDIGYIKGKTINVTSNLDAKLPVFYQKTVTEDTSGKNISLLRDAPSSFSGGTIVGDVLPIYSGTMMYRLRPGEFVYGWNTIQTWPAGGSVLGLGVHLSYPGFTFFNSSGDADFDPAVFDGQFVPPEVISRATPSESGLFPGYNVYTFPFADDPSRTFEFEPSQLVTTYEYFGKNDYDIQAAGVPDYASDKDVVSSVRAHYHLTGFENLTYRPNHFHPNRDLGMGVVWRDDYIPYVEKDVLERQVVVLTNAKVKRHKQTFADHMEKVKAVMHAKGQEGVAAMGYSAEASDNLTAYELLSQQILENLDTDLSSNSSHESWQMLDEVGFSKKEILEFFVHLEHLYHTEWSTEYNTMLHNDGDSVAIVPSEAGMPTHARILRKDSPSMLYQLIMRQYLSNVHTTGAKFKSAGGIPIDAMKEFSATIKEQFNNSPFNVGKQTKKEEDKSQSPPQGFGPNTLQGWGTWMLPSDKFGPANPEKLPGGGPPGITKGTSQNAPEGTMGAMAGAGGSNNWSAGGTFPQGAGASGPMGSTPGAGMMGAMHPDAIANAKMMEKFKEVFFTSYVVGTRPEQYLLDDASSLSLPIVNRYPRIADIEDGIIDVLGTRRDVTRTSIFSPYEPYGISADLGVNTDEYRASNQIAHNINLDDTLYHSPYIDDIIPDPIYNTDIVGVGFFNCGVLPGEPDLGMTNGVDGGAGAMQFPSCDGSPVGGLGFGSTFRGHTGFIYLTTNHDLITETKSAVAEGYHQNGVLGTIYEGWTNVFRFGLNVFGGGPSAVNPTYSPILGGEVAKYHFQGPEGGQWPDSTAYPALGRAVGAEVGANKFNGMTVITCSMIMTDYPRGNPRALINPFIDKSITEAFLGVREIRKALPPRYETDLEATADQYVYPTTNLPILGALRQMTGSFEEGTFYDSLYGTGNAMSVYSGAPSESTIHYNSGSFGDELSKRARMLEPLRHRNAQVDSQPLGGDPGGTYHLTPRLKTNEKAMTSGFTFYGCDRGTDSIVYGGLKK